MTADHENQNAMAGADEPVAAVEDMPAAHSIRNDAELLAALADFFRRNPHVLGGGDILTITGGKPVARAGMLAAVLAGLAIEGGEWAIQKM